MKNIKESILNSLTNLKGSGKFVSAHQSEFIFPGLEVEGFGEIAYPVNAAQANGLIAIAQKAPFGKGNQTLVDTTVRNTWEIDAAKLTFHNSRWADFLNKAIARIKPDLGLEDYKIAAHLYKLLIYEKGSFFLPHKDSEKEKGMFGTLVIELPSKYTGGELVVTFEGVQEVVSFANDTSNYQINYVAFYADCEHQVKPVTSGYRISLVYNLVQQKSGKTIAPSSIENHADALAKILIEHQAGDGAKPAIILLGHQYTPENFSADALKLNDRPKAAALIKAAQKAGYYSKLCLVTSYLSGAPDYDYDEDDENATMSEVYEEELSIEHWDKSDIPFLSNITFEADDLITSFPLNEGEPVMKENTGYMGNYGPDLMHWYHYGALMIWSPDTNAQLLPAQNTTSQLEWIGYFIKNFPKATSREMEAAKSILSNGLEHIDRDSDIDSDSHKKANYNVIAGWVIHQKDETFFLKLNPAVCQSYFVKIDVAHWVKLVTFFSPETTRKLFERVVKPGTAAQLEQLVAILKALPDTPTLHSVAHQQISLLPEYFTTVLVSPGHSQKRLTGTALKNLFEIENHWPQEEVWINSITDAFKQQASRNYIHNVLSPQLLALPKNTALSATLLAFCHNYLQERANNQPQPPINWSREVPSATGYHKQWNLLKAFLESPDEKVFDYRKIQQERSDMENAIRHVVIDLKTETIKKGTPHTLRITKTQDEYKRQLKNWNEDVVLMNRIAEKIKV